MFVILVKPPHRKMGTEKPHWHFNWVSTLPFQDQISPIARQIYSCILIIPRFSGELTIVNLTSATCPYLTGKCSTCGFLGYPIPLFPYYALQPLMSIMNSENINIINLKISRTSTCRTYNTAPLKRIYWPIRRYSTNSSIHRFWLL
jgi:hypothetical protein